jgi:hypothetical protein
MSKDAISVTLEKSNLLWLRGQVSASGRKSVSDLLDSLITEARTGGRVHEAALRSVVGTIDLDAGDPDLAGADRVVRSLFPRSLARTALTARSRRGSQRRRRQGSRRRG